MRFFYLFLLVFVVACRKDGNAVLPDIPDDPNGTKVVVLSRGGSDVFIDDTGNAMRLDGNGCLQGDNLFFTSSKKCDALFYVKTIPMGDLKVGSSAVLKKGDGFVVGSRMFDGATFTRLFVDDIDDVTGDVVLKYQSPFYGSADEFKLNHEGLLLKKEGGDTTVVIVRHTTYNVELASGEWVSLKPHVTHVLLDYSKNMTGRIRFDTLIFSNGVFPDKRLPIIQKFE